MWNLKIIVKIGVWLALTVGLAPQFAIAAGDNEVNVFTWADYISPQIKAAFEKATGLHMNIDVFDSNEALEARLSVGNSGYDVVFTNVEPHLARQIPAGLYQKLDRQKLPNWPNLSPAILTLVAKSADPGNLYGAPWDWGTVGLGYNVAAASQANGGKGPTTLADVFDPNRVKAFSQCGVEMLDSAYDIFPAALQYLHLDPNSHDPQALQKSADIVTAIRPFVRKFSSSGYISDLANGDICLALGYSGDVVIAAQRARESGNGVVLRYVLPQTDTINAFVDVMAIPKDAPHPQNAHILINFLMRPDIAAMAMNPIGFSTANQAALPQIDPRLRNDPNLYPPDTVMRNFTLGEAPTPEFERLRTRAWTRAKSGS